LSVRAAIGSGLALLLAAGALSGCSSGEPAPEEAAPDVVAPGEAVPGATVPAGRTGAAGLAPRTVVALEPVGEATLAEGFIFRWQAPEGAAVVSWRVRVFSTAMSQLWSSGEVTGTEMTAPEALLLRMEPGNSYIWRVTGRLESGGRITSTDAVLVAR
jgi:hypothetical protein